MEKKKSKSTTKKEDKEKKKTKTTKKEVKEVKKETTHHKTKKTTKAVEKEKGKKEVKETHKKKTTHKTTKKKSRKRKTKVVIAKGKRKKTIARATVKEGNGRITLNKSSVDSIQNKYLKAFLIEPVNFIGSKMSKIDISVNVRGGGLMGQLQAARTAIARALVEYFEEDKLEKKMYEYDRYLLGNDTRRVEPKKDRARKARAKYQKSYR